MTDEPSKRVEEMHTAGGYSISTLLIVSWALALVVAPHDAIARIGKCKIGSLTPAEESLLLAAASRILPKHADLIVSNLCGSTFAEITSQKIADRPGGSHWWVANCRRDSLEWVCDRIQFQEVEKRLIIRGRPLQVATTFDEGTVPEAVESVATRALNIYADPGSQLIYCGEIEDPGNRWTALRKEHPVSVQLQLCVHLQVPRFSRLFPAPVRISRLRRGPLLIR